MQKNIYDLQSIKMPRLAGAALKTVVSLMEKPATRSLVIAKSFQALGVNLFRDSTIDEPPTLFPHWEQHRKKPAKLDLKQWSKKPRPGGKGFHFTTARDYAEAYRSGKTDPEKVAGQVLGAIEESNACRSALRAIIVCQHEDVYRQARASAKRWKAGKQLSLFDGVPVAVKDEVDLVPYGTTFGTAFLGKTPAVEDSTVAARMRAAGALLIGKANMHEIGIGVTGLNPHHGVTRNPYNPAHHSGGSSSGSAAAVASGLCPAAIGADGGGSIRVPSSFCGLVGLKATFGRISEYSSSAVCWSVAHNGPIAATAADAALMYALIAGADPKDSHTLHQPPVDLDRFDNLDLGGLTLGIFTPWFEHADPEMVAACQKMIKKFKSMGAKTREIEIAELGLGRTAHIITIATEMRTALSQAYQDNPSNFGLDTRANLALAGALTATDYIKAQQMRTRLINRFRDLFSGVDLIITPATGITAPPIAADALPDGENDLATLTEIMRYSTYANLTGLPAISFPVGYSKAGLPIGMQAIGRAWEESLLLRLAHAAEQVVERLKPQLHYRILPD